MKVDPKLSHVSLVRLKPVRKLAHCGLDYVP